MEENVDLLLPDQIGECLAWGGGATLTGRRDISKYWN